MAVLAVEPFSDFMKRYSKGATGKTDGLCEHKLQKEFMFLTLGQSDGYSFLLLKRVIVNRKCIKSEKHQKHIK